MREIKFRAWDSFASKMWDDVYFDGGHIFTIGGDGETESMMPRWGDNALMQFIGIKDKNGKEIYEGDVVIWEDKNSNFPNVMQKKEIVRWENTSFVGFSVFYKNEVIGNIHEHPELVNL